MDRDRTAGGGNRRWLYQRRSQQERPSGLYAGRRLFHGGAVLGGQHKGPCRAAEPDLAEHRRCFDAYAELLDPPAEKVGEAIPTELRQLLDSGDKQNFDRFFEEGMQAAPRVQRQNWEWRAKPYGLNSPFDVFTAARQYNLADVVDEITTPLLITNPEGEQFWPGQSQQLFDKLSGKKQLVVFTADEGAERHCEPLARSLLEQRMFDWLDETLPS